jgi:uncharacterized MAPEG superfamily protein
MNLIYSYSLSFWGIIIILLTWQIQWLIASKTKAAQPGAIPGKIDEQLSHDSFVFRAHRTFQNSLENLPAFLAAALLAILIGTEANWTTLFIWIFALARIAQMILYYAIATEKNPSPRTYFFLIGLFANAGLIVLCAITLI